VHENACSLDISLPEKLLGVWARIYKRYMKVNFFKGGWFLAISILLLHSCSIDKQDQNFAYSSFKELDSLEIVMPEEFLQHTNWTTFRKDERTMLVEYGLNGVSDLVIHQVDFNDELYSNTIIIPREGPDGYNSSEASVFIKGEDSLYVFPAARSSFFLYNSEGKKVNEYQYNSSRFERYYKNGYYSSMITLGEEMILTTVNDTRYDDPDYFNKVSPIQFYEPNSSKFVDKIGFPEFVQGKYLPSSLSGAMITKIDEDQMLINYNFSDSIYIYNIPNKVTTSFYCGSNHFGRPNLLEKLPNQSQELEYKVKEVNYELGFYHNGRIYRIVSHLSADKYRDYSVFEIVSQNLMAVSLIEMDLKTGLLKYYQMPIAKYFVFQDNFLFAGGVSIREDESNTYRRFYKYTLE